jgi:hypothetical protein
MIVKRLTNHVVSKSVPMEGLGLERMDKLKAIDLATNPGCWDPQNGGRACGGRRRGCMPETSTTSSARI